MGNHQQHQRLCQYKYDDAPLHRFGFQKTAELHYPLILNHTRLILQLNRIGYVSIVIIWWQL